MEVTEIKYFVEAALLAAARPLSIDQLKGLFDESSSPDKSDIREALTDLQEEYKPRGIEVTEVASGFRMQVKANMAERLERLWEERPPRYSRALFETLALIAYRQPMTRGEIEEIRGVAVSSNIIRSLLERDWVRVVGHRDVPGRPSMFGTTRQFLDYFGLKKLDDLPPLADLSDWESLRVQLNLPAVEGDEVDTGEDPELEDSDAVAENKGDTDDESSFEDSDDGESAFDDSDDGETDVDDDSASEASGDQDAGPESEDSVDESDIAEAEAEIPADDADTEDDVATVAEELDERSSNSASNG